MNIVGDVTITITDNDGNRDICRGKNKVLDVGIAALWQRLGGPDGANANKFHNVYFGDDIGTGGSWSIFNPQPVNQSFTSANQNVTHELNPSSVSFEYPTDDVLLVTAFVDGSQFMEDHFPNEVEYRFTSMTLRTLAGTPFAFRRFPIRSISRFVQVRIDWRFTLINEEEWCSDE